MRPPVRIGVKCVPNGRVTAVLPRANVGASTAPSSTDRAARERAQSCQASQHASAAVAGMSQAHELVYMCRLPSA